MEFISKYIHEFKYSNLTRLLIKVSSGSYIIKILGAFISFILQIVLTRTLGAYEYGYYIFVLTWINMFTLIGVFGFSTASIKFVSQYYSKKEWSSLKGYLSYSNKLTLVISCIISIIVFIFSKFVVSRLRPELYVTSVVASFLLPAMSFLQLKQAEMTGLKRIIESQAIYNIYRPIIIIMGVYLILFIPFINRVSESVMGLNLLATLSSVLIMTFLANKSYPDFKNISPEYAKKFWFLTAKDMLLIAGFNLILFRADTIMIGLLSTTTNAGYYSISSRIALFLVFILASVNSVLSPLISELTAKKQYKNLQKIVSQGAKIVFIISTVGGFLLVVSGKWILTLFGQEFTTAYYALIILVVGQVINAFAGPAILSLNMTGYQKVSAKILGISAFINIILNLFFIPHFGINGAALSTTITMFIWNIAAVILSWKFLNLNTTAFTFLNKIYD